MATKQNFAVWAPTHTDPEVQSRRADVRPAHLEHLVRLFTEGILKFGGPISDPASGDANGSMLVLELESAAAVRAELEKDPYWINNVWDKEKTEIKPINITIIGDAAAAQSKATATKQTFAVWAPAQTDPEVQSRRDDVHRGHAINIERLATEGILRLGGPIFDPGSDGTDGSMLVLALENVAAVTAELEKDPYWTGNIWNKENIEIKTINLSVIGDAAAAQSKA